MNNFPTQEPRPRPLKTPHAFVIGKVATQCALCFLREHNEIHVEEPPAAPSTTYDESVDGWLGKRSPYGT